MSNKIPPSGSYTVLVVKPNSDERASLHGLTPEEALRALLAVKPSEPANEPGEEEEPG